MANMEEVALVMAMAMVKAEKVVAVRVVVEEEAAG